MTKQTSHILGCHIQPIICCRIKVKVKREGQVLPFKILINTNFDRSSSSHHFQFRRNSTSDAVRLSFFLSFCLSVPNFWQSHIRHSTFANTKIWKLLEGTRNFYKLVEISRTFQKYFENVQYAEQLKSIETSRKFQNLLKKIFKAL